MVVALVSVAFVAVRFAITAVVRFAIGAVSVSITPEIIRAEETYRLVEVAFPSTACPA